MMIIKIALAWFAIAIIVGALAGAIIRHGGKDK